MLSEVSSPPHWTDQIGPAIPAASHWGIQMIDTGLCLPTRPSRAAGLPHAIQKPSHSVLPAVPQPHWLLPAAFWQSPMLSHSGHLTIRNRLPWSTLPHFSPNRYPILISISCGLTTDQPLNLHMSIAVVLAAWVAF